MTTAPTHKRLTFISPTDPIVFSQQHIFVRTDNPKMQKIMAIKSIEGLKERFCLC